MYAPTSGDKVPQRASAQYVSTFFDRFADSFDSTLERLDYAAPQLLYEALVQRVACGRSGLAVLDAGCGTGLCGALLRSTAKFLAGVDQTSTPFRINAHGRYAHAGGYLRDIMESSGFSAVECRSVVLRKEFGNDVKGHLVIGSALS
jgi:predicted TPR repeat methyltransferase